MAIKKKVVSELPLSDMTVSDTLSIEQVTDLKTQKEKQTSKISNAESLKVQSVERLSLAFDVLVKELNALEDLKRKTKEDLELEKRQFKQQAEQDNLTTLLSERKRRAEFDEKLEKEKKQFEESVRSKEVELKTKGEALDMRLAELEELKAQAESFPVKLGKAVEEAKKQISVELKKDFDNEKVLLTQKYQSELKLLEQQIASLQNQNKQQEKEMTMLRTEKTKAIEQIKDLAVAVIHGKESDGESHKAEHKISGNVLS